MSDARAISSIDPSDIDASFAPSRAEGVRMVLVDDEAVLLDEQHDRLHVLDRIGALVWQCFDGLGTIDDLCSDLADEFGAPRALVESDVLTLTRSLGAAGVLDGVVPPAERDEWGEQVMEAPSTDPRFVGPPPSL